MVGESAGMAIGQPEFRSLGSTDIIFMMVDDDKPDLKIHPFDEVSQLAVQIGLDTYTSSFTDKAFRRR